MRPVAALERHLLLLVSAFLAVIMEPRFCSSAILVATIPPTLAKQPVHRLNPDLLPGTEAPAETPRAPCAASRASTLLRAGDPLTHPTSGFSAGSALTRSSTSVRGGETVTCSVGDAVTWLLVRGVIPSSRHVPCPRTVSQSIRLAGFHDTSLGTKSRIGSSGGIDL